MAEAGIGVDVDILLSKLPEPLKDHAEYVAKSPVSPDRNEYWISQIRGLRELFMSGGITGDEFDWVVAQSKAVSENQAEIDGLTRLYNRTGFNRKMTEVIAESRRYSFPLTVLFLDIDRLKIINDEKGHASGDLILRGLATIIEKNKRTEDVAGRIGGDEFVIAVVHSEKEGGQALIERLQTKINLIINSPAFSGLSQKVGVSIGFVEWDGNEMLGDLLKRADQQMYEQKRKNKNG